MDKDSKIYVAGHRGLVGSAIVRGLRAEGYGKLLMRTSREPWPPDVDAGEPFGARPVVPARPVKACDR